MTTTMTDHPNLAPDAPASQIPLSWAEVTYEKEKVDLIPILSKLIDVCEAVSAVEFEPGAWVVFVPYHQRREAIDAIYGTLEEHS